MFSDILLPPARKHGVITPEHHSTCLHPCFDIVTSQGPYCQSQTELPKIGTVLSVVRYIE
jgi:hypothetical protein